LHACVLYIPLFVQFLHHGVNEKENMFLMPQRHLRTSQLRNSRILCDWQEMLTGGRQKCISDLWCIVGGWTSSSGVFLLQLSVSWSSASRKAPTEYRSWELQMSEKEAVSSRF